MKFLTVEKCWITYAVLKSLEVCVYSYSMLTVTAKMYLKYFESGRSIQLCDRIIDMMQIYWVHSFSIIRII